MTSKEIKSMVDWKEISQLWAEKLHRVRELHSRGLYGECRGCDNRCGCFEGDILERNKWETCPTIKALDGEQ